MRTLLIFALALFAASAFAHGPREPRNLRVLSARRHEDVERGMKLLAAGLGVKCSACHVGGNQFELDDRPAKIEARKFLASAVREPSREKRAHALRALLVALEMREPKDEPLVWAAFNAWTPKK